MSRIQLLSAIDDATAAALRDWLGLHRAGIEHDPRWLAVLRESLGHRPLSLAARDGAGNFRGWLPMVSVSSRLFGRFLVSLPYLNRGGVVADDLQTAAALLDEADSLAARMRVQYLELRQPGEPLRHPMLNARREDKVNMLLDLPSDDDPESLWSAIGSKVRNQIRKGDKNDLAIRFGGAELLDGFYDVFAENMRDLGTPVYPRKLFASILDRFADEAELVLVTCGGAPAAGALLLHWRTHAAAPQRRACGMTQIPSASCLRRFNATNANMWMYHRVLLRAMERGSARFDFGRSTPDSGTYRFKKQWGATPEPTTWQYHVRHGELGMMRPDHPKMRRRVEAWQRLPVWVTRMVGPRIVRGIP